MALDSSPGPAAEQAQALRERAAAWQGDLRGRDLAGVDLARLDLDGADLVRADLRQASLVEARLARARVHGAALRGADLGRVRAPGLLGRDADLEGARLGGANLDDADLRRANLLDADLTEATLRGADLAWADLRGADLRGADLSGARLDGADLVGARLDGAVLADLRASGARFGPGLDPAAEATLRAAGAYRGLPPAVVALALSPVQATQAGARLVGEARTTGARLRLAGRASAVWIDERREQARQALARRAEQLRAEREAARARRVTAAQARRERDDEARSWRAARQRARRAEALARRRRLSGEPTPPAEAPAERVEATRSAQDALHRDGADREARLLAEHRARVAQRRALVARGSSPGPLFAAPPSTAALVRQDREIQAARRRAARDREGARLDALGRGLAAADAAWTERRHALLRELEARAVLRETRRAAGPPPGGAGIDLEGADLAGRRLAGAQWPGARLAGARLGRCDLGAAHLSGADLRAAALEGARLSRARLDGATLVEARLDGARLRDASLAGAQLARASLVDADLRNADLGGADLAGADLTGADLRGARLAGARLVGANLRAARMADLDLGQAVLDDAVLDQADLSGVAWEGASVRGLDLTGALGLGHRERRTLLEAGARTEDGGLDELFGRFASKQIRTAALVLGLGATAWLATRFLAEDSYDPEALEAEAEALRDADPREAAGAYEELAASAPRTDDRVGYLLEAAALFDGAGEGERALALLDRALEEAGESAALAASVRLFKASALCRWEQWDACMEVVRPALLAEGQPAEQRARAMVLYQSALAMAAPDDPAAGTVPDEVFASLAELPEAEADLRLAIAEIRSSQGQTEAALGEIDRVEALALPEDLALRAAETRARILDRGGDLAGAARTFEALRARAGPSAVAHQAASLALADLYHRQGDQVRALAMTEPLLAPGVDPRIQGRALLLRGRLHEQADELALAAQAYRDALALRGIEPETTEQAQVSLARALLAEGATGEAQAALSLLAPEDAAEILVHARLGQARRALDGGDAAAALAIFEAVQADDGATDDLRRAARMGTAECFARLEDLNRAIAIWRDLLADEIDPEQRAWTELQLAHGLLQGGRRAEAATAFASLARSTEDPEVRFPALLGLAQVHRATGERERARTVLQRVADEAPTAALRVDALLELADLAAEDGHGEEALAHWRTLLGILPPGHPAAAETRLAVVQALASAGDLDAGLDHCGQAADGDDAALRVALACAELAERAQRLDEAQAAYGGLLARPDAPVDVVEDAALGAARAAMAASRPGAAVDAIEAGLARVVAPESRLPLLSMRVQALQQAGSVDPARLATAVAERDALAESVPALAGPILVDAAARARGAGDLGAALDLLRKAVELPMTDEERAGARVELGDALLEAGEAAAAREAFAAAAASSDELVAFAAGMGLAEADRREGKLEQAIRRLDRLEAPDPGSRLWLLEARANAHTAAQTPDAIDAWRALGAAADGDAQVEAAALRGQADALAAQDRPEEALPLYRQSASKAPDLATQGWAALGEAECLLALDRPAEAEAVLAPLRRHADREVALQAMIRSAQQANGREAWGEALALVGGQDARDLGAGWDASLVSVQAAALAGAGRLDDAMAAWAGLEARWPDNPEARVGAWLGRADVTLRQGDLDAAGDWAERALAATDDPVYRQRALQTLAALGR